MHKEARKRSFGATPTMFNLLACPFEHYPKTSRTVQLEAAEEYVSRLYHTDTAEEYVSRQPTLCSYIV